MHVDGKIIKCIIKGVKQWAGPVGFARIASVVLMFWGCLW